MGGQYLQQIRVAWVHEAQDRRVSCEYGKESEVSIKCGEFLEQMSNNQLLKKDFAPWNLFNILCTCIF